MFDSVYQVVTWVWIAFSIGAFFFYASKQTGGERGMLFSILSLVCSVVVMIALVARNHYLSKPEDKKRPELSIEQAVVELLEPGKHETAALVLKNRGEVAARNITIRHYFAIATEGFKGPLIYYQQPEPEACPDLGVGATMTVVGQGIESLTAEMFRGFRSGKNLLFHYGKGEYEDDAGNKYPLKYCFMYDPDRITSMRIATRYLPTDDGSQPAHVAAPKERPDLSLEKAKVRFRPGKAAEVRILLQNRGNVGAHNIWFRGVHYTFPAPFKDSLPVESLPERDKFPHLAVNAMMTGFTVEGEVLSIKDIADIEDGKLLFFHYSKGHYEDENGNVYPMDFCLMYVPGREDLALAPIEYWPKSENDKKRN